MLGDPDHPITDVWDLTEDRCVDLVHAGLGTEDVAVAIEDVHRWECRADLADSFRRDRIFLVGDAAHVMPPYGGFGGNTAIQDAHNLAWKLAFVINGGAGPELLCSDARSSCSRAPQAHELNEDARQAAASFGMTVDVHQVGGESELVDPLGNFCEAFGITVSGAVLVRPDASSRGAPKPRAPGRPTHSATSWPRSWPAAPPRPTPRTEATTRSVGN